jgi:hypothetical protein
VVSRAVGSDMSLPGWTLFSTASLGAIGRGHRLGNLCSGVHPSDWRGHPLRRLNRPRLLSLGADRACLGPRRRQKESSSQAPQSHTDAASAPGAETVGRNGEKLVGRGSDEAWAGSQGCSANPQSMVKRVQRGRAVERLPPASGLAVIVLGKSIVNRRGAGTDGSADLWRWTRYPEEPYFPCEIL